MRGAISVPKFAQFEAEAEAEVEEELQ